MRIRVLIGDPDQELLTVFRAFLTAHGFEVAATDNEDECLQRLGEFVPDVLVLEVDQARSWGGHLVAAMQDGKELGDVPVIALTHGDGCVPEGLSTGPIRACLVKPFSMTELVDGIHEIVGSPA
jgi:DNA-binding response OmpR family regulator